MAFISVSASVGPHSRVGVFDRPGRDGRRVVGVELDDTLTVLVQGWDGDAAIVAAAGMMADAYGQIRDAAAQRIRDAAAPDIERLMLAGDASGKAWNA